jgi:hypothetical protein
MKTAHARIRAYALLLNRTTKYNPAVPSRLAHDSEADFDQLSDDRLISQARTILRETRLTTFTVSTRVEAVAVIRGLRPAGRLQ